MKASIYPIAHGASSSAGGWRWLVVADDPDGERHQWMFATRAEARKKLAALRRRKGKT